MRRKDNASYEYGRKHAHDYLIEDEMIDDWLTNSESSESDQDGAIAWFYRGVLDGRSDVVVDEQSMLLSYNN